jgi:hypothetical protein
MFSTIKRLGAVTLLTKVEGNESPIFFHSLFEPAQPRKEDESWSTTTWHCALSGLFDEVKVVKLNQTKQFQRVTVNHRYSVLDLLKISSDSDLSSIEPLKSGEMKEFTLSDMRNSAPVPPFILKKLLAVDHWNRESLTIGAVRAMKAMMYEAIEIEDLSTEQAVLDAPPDEERPLSELSRELDNKKKKQTALNKRWQQLAEDCGLGVVLFLLNFDEANETVFENVIDSPSVAEEAWELISSKVNTVYSIKDDAFRVIKDAAPQQQHDRHQDNIQSVEHSESEEEAPPLLTNKRKAIIDLPAAPEKKPAAASNADSLLERLVTALEAKSEKETKTKVSNEVKQALLLGGSTNGITMATEVPTTGMEILSTTSEAQALTLLTRAFRKLDHPMVRFSPAQVKCIRTFRASWSRNELPQGFSNLCNKLWSAEVETSDFMVKIRAKEESNTPLTEAEVSKLTKNTYHLPTKLVPMLRSLKTQMCLLKIFFGPNAFVSVCYQEFLDKLARSEQDMEMMIARDPMFPTHLLLRVDNVVRIFLDAVVVEDSIKAIPFSCLSEFNAIYNELAMDKFLIPTVPKWISTVSNSEIISDPKDEADKSPGNGRRKGKKNSDLGGMITNNNVLPRLCITAEEYKKKLSHDKHQGIKPKKCIKWHIRGLCFDKCRYIKNEGHAPLSKTEEDEMFKFLQANGLRK